MKNIEKKRYSIPMHYFIFPRNGEYDDYELHRLRKFLSSNKIDNDSYDELSSKLMTGEELLDLIETNKEDRKNLSVEENLNIFLKEMKSLFCFSKCQVYLNENDKYTYSSNDLLGITSKLYKESEFKEKCYRITFNQTAYPIISGIRLMSDDEFIDTVIESKTQNINDTVSLAGLSLTVGLIINRNFLAKKKYERKFKAEDFSIDIPFTSEEIGYVFSEDVLLQTENAIDFLRPLVKKINKLGYYELSIDVDKEEDLIIINTKYGKENINILNKETFWTNIFDDTNNTEIVDEELFIKDKIKEILDGKKLSADQLKRIQEILLEN